MLHAALMGLTLVSPSQALQGAGSTGDPSGEPKVS